ncbi:MAG: sulfatase-like hydrolase/transferase, partial [Prosthecobacter sp.]|nr:sulfatase-like hydrolase/transferase [Prosthecobacter sp.]
MKPLLLLLTLVFATISLAERPNIVLVLADDLGYGDLACFGARDVQTPNLDRFASEGLRFTSCYAGHANCSPSRTALMTGRTPTRVGVRNWIPEDSPVHVRRSEITIAKLLQQS